VIPIRCESCNANLGLVQAAPGRALPMAFCNQECAANWAKQWFAAQDEEG
jgi:hypothetical protein